jgi:hypothetical protein
MTVEKKIAARTKIWRLSSNFTTTEDARRRSASPSRRIIPRAVLQRLWVLARKSQQHPAHIQSQNPRASVRDPHAPSRQEDESYNATPPGAWASEHGPLPSSREATGWPSPSQSEVIFAKTQRRRRAKTTRCTCPYRINGYN